MWVNMFNWQLEEVYVELPPGNVKEWKEDKDYKLKKELYELK